VIVNSLSDDRSKVSFSSEKNRFKVKIWCLKPNVVYARETKIDLLVNALGAESVKKPRKAAAHSNDSPLGVKPQFFHSRFPIRAQNFRG
jgi:hypothetical protein